MSNRPRISQVEETQLRSLVEIAVRIISSINENFPSPAAEMWLAHAIAILKTLPNHHLTDTDKAAIELLQFGTLQ